jgi:predicted TIM-barrel enzyme
VKKKPTLYPVIHYLDDRTTFSEARLALNTPGVDGVFFISHIGSRAVDTHLIQIAREMKQVFPTRYIGVNLLTASDPLDHVIYQVQGQGIDMVWFDTLGITSQGVSPLAKLISEKIAEEEMPLTVFCGTAFKYQAVEPYPEQAAKLTFEQGFIPTTSGEATGVPPSVKKLKLMSVNGVRPLAVASGMTAQNVAMFAPYLTHILVATGISRDEYHIDPAKLAAFIAALEN